MLIMSDQPKLYTVNGITRPITTSTDSEYLNNIIAPIELLGLAPGVNPLYNHISSQREMMLSAQLVQTICIRDAQPPLLFSGLEGRIGSYERDMTSRDQDIEVLAVIPKYSNSISTQGSKNITPYHTVIYRGDSDNRIGYFNYEQFTLRTDGYGYPNKLIGWNRLITGNVIFKDEKLITSPLHDGSKYMQGTNLNVAFMDIPHTTEDAFVISESAAKRLTGYGYSTISFKIDPDIIPLNLYGNDDDEYKFIPDIGERVHDNGILCAFRIPTELSAIYDTAPDNLSTYQPLHDKVIYAPPGAEIVDIDIVVNRTCKSKIPEHIFSQVKKYRDLINEYNYRVIKCYQKAKSEGRDITDSFNTLVTKCMESLVLDGLDVPSDDPRQNFINKSRAKLKFKPYRRREEIKFIYVTVTYKYDHVVHRGFKITNRS